MISISFSASLKLKPIPEELRMQAQGPFFTYTAALCVFQDNQESFGKRLYFPLYQIMGFWFSRKKHYSE